MFKKRKPSIIQCDTKEFCKVETVFARKVSRKYHYIIPYTHYAFLSQDGRNVGMPAPLGGKIYPFSDDASRRGSRREKKRYTIAKLVVIHKQFKVQIRWGIGPAQQVKILDPKTQIAYVLGASGSFDVQLDPRDMGTSANKFYQTLVDSATDFQSFDADALNQRLIDRFVQALGDSIDRVFLNAGITVRDNITLTTGEMGLIAKALEETMKNIYAEDGLILSGLVIGNVVIREKYE